MIETFYTKTIAVKRQAKKTDVNGNKYSEDTTVGNIVGHLQQARAELAESLAMDLTKTFLVWCDVDANVKAGDTLTIDSVEYSVKALQENRVGYNQHLELIIEKNEDSD